jgi:hypothetical protein
VHFLADLISDQQFKLNLTHGKFYSNICQTGVFLFEPVENPTLIRKLLRKVIDYFEPTRQTDLILKRARLIAFRFMVRFSIISNKNKPV